MKSALGRWVAAAAVIVVGTGIALSTGASAFATGTTPPYEPDPQSVGTVTFYDSSGNAITSGSINDTPMAAYAVGSATIVAGDTSANLIAAQPNPSALTANWNTDFLGGFTAYPITSGAPASIETLSQTFPVATGTAGDLSLNDFIAEFPNDPAHDSNTSYQNLYQLRLETANGSVTHVNSYDVADVLVSGTTWTQVYPGPATPTTTTLAVVPPSPVTQGTSVTLTANVSTTADDTVHPAGTVEFFEGSTSLGSKSVNTTTGDAVLTTTKLLPTDSSGKSLTAVYTAVSGSGDGGSTSNAVNYVVDPVAATPKISGKVKVGETVKCDESLSSGEKATYEWSVDGKDKATGKSYSIPGSAYKDTLTCTATVSVGDSPTSSATSAGQKVAQGKALKNTQKPKLSGPHKAGKKETVSTGKWSPKASSYAYQWFDGNKKIKGATKDKLKLKKSEKGDKISCDVTASKKGYADGEASSKSVKVT
jgi:hypothetical protein